MDKPFAITLDIRSSLANHTGTWRSERPVYVDGLPPCTARLPRRRAGAGVAVLGRGRQLRDGLAPLWSTPTRSRR